MTSLLMPCSGIGRRFIRSRQSRLITTSSSTPGPPYKILFCGTDSFAATSLSALLSHRPSLCSSIHVLTPPDVTQSWGANRMKVSPVKQLALSHHLPHQHVPSTGMADYTLPSAFPLSIDSILLTCSFGHLIPSALLYAFPNPWQRINIHPSLLPQLRGAAPIQWALARRFSSSGVSIQTLEKGTFDTGRILAQSEFAFPPIGMEAAGFQDVERVMAERAAELLLQMLRDLPSHWSASWEQDERQKTYAPKLKAEFSIVKWDKMVAEDVVARERAFSYLYPLNSVLSPPTKSSSFRPVSVNFFDTSAISLQDLTLADSLASKVLHPPSVPAGSTLYSTSLDALLIKAQADSVLLVRTLKVHGKKAKSASEWWKAYRDRADPTTGLLTFV